MSPWFVLLIAACIRGNVLQMISDALTLSFLTTLCRSAPFDARQNDTKLPGVLHLKHQHVQRRIH